MDVEVDGPAWQVQPGGAVRANIGGPIDPGSGRLQAMPPAVPPSLHFSEPPRPKGERGVIHVESTPPGAAVWLFIGVSNHVELSGIEAGRDYDLRVTKDGFVPGFTHITAEEWRNGGDPKLPLSSAPKKSVIERAVKLLPSIGASALPAKAP